MENLLGVVSALRPEFNNTSIAYVSNGSDPQVSADMAGGFVGDGQAVDINYGNNNSGFKADTDTNPSSSESTGEKNSEEADFISAVTIARMEQQKVRLVRCNNKYYRTFLYKGNQLCRRLCRKIDAW